VLDLPRYLNSPFNPVLSASSLVEDNTPLCGLRKLVLLRSYKRLNITSPCNICEKVGAKIEFKGVF
jgi:hypothetical protein